MLAHRSWREPELANGLTPRSLFFYSATFAKGEPIAFLLNSYRKRQWSDVTRIEFYQLTQLKRILAFSYKNSDFYRKRFDEWSIDVGSIESLEGLKKIPTISKDDLISSLDSISGRNAPLFSSSKTTGGSTGQPVKLYKNPFALARERCATARSYEWAGVQLGDRQLRFWGVPHSRAALKKATVADLVANRKRVSAFDLSSTSFLEYYNQAIRFRPRYIYGYVSVIEQFAKYVLEKGLSPLPSVVSIITTSEILTAGARETIERAFSAKVFNEYGCGEVGSIAHECEHGNMHLMADNLIVEVDSEGSGSGEIIVTDLFNTATPLIRYRLGDYATLSGEKCSCGRGLPLVKGIHGRAYDIIETPSGKKIHPESIIYVFEGFQSSCRSFKQFQVIQESKDNISVNIIANDSWSYDIEERLLRALKRDVDKDIQYKINLVDSIKRESSGKMRLVKSMV